MDDTVQGGPKRSARKITGRQERPDTPGRPTMSTLARPDALQAAWNDGDRILTRQTRQDEKGGPQPVLVVRLAAEHPSRASLDRLAHEYGLRDELDSAWAAKPLGFIKDNGRSALVLEDCGGVPLRQLIGEREHGMAAELPLFLRLAIGIAAAVSKVHERGLIHRDIKPANILVNEADGQIRLTGFGVASRLPRERQVPEPPEVIAGTLAYMAPEQTGRMNRSVDSRSDLYAVGVTLLRDAHRQAAVRGFGSHGMGALPHCQATGATVRADEESAARRLGNGHETARQERRGALPDRRRAGGRSATRPDRMGGPGADRGISARDTRSVGQAAHS